ncbi:N-6 DNA methylase [Luedemannella flava]|uniref:N-6 DNA methylase n=1 Tax=Luedemannella flava TaxID=349316 RepID=UPI0031E1438F
MTTNRDEVTAAEIARIAEVGRAAVSNWRRRYADFPQPVGGTPTSPTFAWADVEQWLRANGRLGNPPSGGPAEPVPGQNAPEMRMVAVPVMQGATLRRQMYMGQVKLAAAVAGLLPPLRQGTVVDPDCGLGAILAAVAGELPPTVRIVGQDPSTIDVNTANRLLAEAGAHHAEALVGSPFGEDALRAYRGTADLAVCLAPGRLDGESENWASELHWEFGQPSPADAALGWLQVCYGYLKPGGLAIVVMPYSASVRGSAKRIRAELLRSGALAQVVALPSGFGAPLSGPHQIWVLQRPSGRPSYTVRLVDLSETRPEDVPRDADGWERVYADRTLTAEVPSIELLDEDVLLLPARYVEPPVGDLSRDYADLRDALARAVDDLDVALPVFEATASVPFPLASVVDLIRAGALAIVDKDTALQPGDVIIPAGDRQFDATVAGDPPPDRPDRTAGEVVRCDPEQLDPYFLACFLRSGFNRRQATGTLGGTFRLDLRRCRVPRLPLAEQRRYGEAFRRLTEVTDRFDDAAAVATNALRTAVYGLTSGAFLPEDASGITSPQNGTA